MTELTAPPHTTPAPRALDAALRVAQAAARASGVHIRELAEVDDVQQLCELVDEIWHPNPANAPVTAELLRALAFGGSYVAGAFAEDQLAGGCMGFFGAPAERTLHSHIAFASPRLPGKHVGFALKLHQRAWALSRDISTIAWTFDPLVCRNAYFNVAKLAASPVDYLPDFYGPMHDVINGEDDSDRLLVHWPLAADSVTRACQGARPGRRRGPAASGGCRGGPGHRRRRPAGDRRGRHRGLHRAGPGAGGYRGRAPSPRGGRAPVAACRAPGARRPDGRRRPGDGIRSFRLVCRSARRRGRGAAPDRKAES